MLNWVKTIRATTINTYLARVTMGLFDLFKFEEEPNTKGNYPKSNPLAIKPSDVSTLFRTHG
jgi:hypothetical protein